MPIDDGALEALAGLGNSSHLYGYIMEYEKRIDAEKETAKSLAECPNYYAWVTVASEFVYYTVKETLFLGGNATNVDIYELGYADLLNRIFADPKMTPALKDDLLLFARIRHLIVHKGFPNPHQAPSRAERTLAKGEVYDFASVWEVARRLRGPSGFPSLKDAFRRVQSGLREIRGPFSKSF